MATPTINLTLLEYFAPVLLLILVFTLLYAVFQWAKILGDHKVIHGVIAFLIAIVVTVYSESARSMIEFMIPWFTMLAIFLVLSIMLYKIFGATDDDVRQVIRSRSDVQWTLFIIIVIIILGALAKGFGQQQLGFTQEGGETGVIDAGNPGTQETSSGSFNQNLGATFYHPKVLGTLFLLLVGAITVAFLARPVYKT